MSKLPILSGQECIKSLGKAGFYILRQRGSHIILRRDEPFGEVVVLAILKYHNQQVRSLF
jgi:predicted RNA binding protein YcfA (HicA-like mRNA interferase family)